MKSKKPLFLIPILLVSLFFSFQLLGSFDNKETVTKAKQVNKEVDESFYKIEKEEKIKIKPIKEEKDAPSTEDVWEVLLAAKYKPSGLYGYTPIFGPKQKALDGKQVTISGYMYPLEEQQKQNFFMLSYYPISRCFFCGGAGPQSMIEINSKVGVLYRKRRIQITGKLELNKDDPERLFYIINDAK